MHRNSVVIKATLLALVAVAMTGCASGPRIITNGDPTADWNQYKTFGFFEPLGTDRYQIRSITSNQLIAATTRELQAAGFTRSDTNPDLLINFVLSSRQTLQTRPTTSTSFHHGSARYRTWSGWSASVSTTEVVSQTEGTLGVDIVDRARSQLIWEGAATKRITDSTRRNQEEVLDGAIADIFAEFP